MHRKEKKLKPYPNSKYSVVSTYKCVSLSGGWTAVISDGILNILTDPGISADWALRPAELLKSKT